MAVKEKVFLIYHYNLILHHGKFMLIIPIIRKCISVQDLFWSVTISNFSSPNTALHDLSHFSDEQACNKHANDHQDHRHKCPFHPLIYRRLIDPDRHERLTGRKNED